MSKHHGVVKHTKEGDIEELWFFDPQPINMPVDLTITQWGFDLRGKNCAGAVLLRVFTPKWWSADQKNDLAQTYATLIELRAQGVPT